MDEREMELLVQKAKNKDTEAFTAIYKTVYRNMYQFAYYTLGNQQDAEDAVSEAVMDAFYGLHKLQEAKAFKSWIFKILTAKCKRKLKGYLTKTLPLNVDLETSAVNVEENMDVRNAFLRLNLKERMIISLSILSGYKSIEIGQILHMNHNTVRSIHSRALEKMKVMLKS